MTGKCQNPVHIHMDAAGIKKLFSHGIRRYFARTDTRESRSWIINWNFESLFTLMLYVLRRKAFVLINTHKTLKPTTAYNPIYNFHPVHYLRSPLCNLSLQSLNIIGPIGNQPPEMVMMFFLRWMHLMQVLRLGLQLVQLTLKTMKMLSLSQRLVRLLVKGVVVHLILQHLLDYPLDIFGLVTLQSWKRLLKPVLKLLGSSVRIINWFHFMILMFLFHEFIKPV